MWLIGCCTPVCFGTDDQRDQFRVEHSIMRLTRMRSRGGSSFFPNVKDFVSDVFLPEPIGV